MSVPHNNNDVGIFYNHIVDAIRIDSYHMIEYRNYENDYNIFTSESYHFSMNIIFMFRFKLGVTSVKRCFVMISTNTTIAAIPPKQYWQYPGSGGSVPT